MRVVQTGHGKPLYGKTIVGTVGYMGGIQSLPVEFVESLANIIQYNYEHLLGPAQRIRYIRPTVSLHSAARNQLAEFGIGDWLVMLDTDMIHDADTVARLVWTANAYDADVVTGLYYKIVEPHFPSLYGWDPKEYIFREAMTSPSLMTPFPVDASGAGVLLVRTRLFERMREVPSFGGPFDVEPSIVSGQPPFGEDLSFFLKCGRLDPPPKIICNPAIVSRHLRMGSITTEDHEEELAAMTVVPAPEDDDESGDAVVMYGGQVFDAHAQEVEA